MHNRITSSDENFSDDEIFAEVALDDPAQVGGAFFNKSDRKKTPKNMDHLMRTMFNNLLGCFYCDELRFKSEFLELNCCSSHTGYFLKIWRLFGGGDGGFFPAW